ncbi:MAG: AI-2E family transporter [Rhodanobacteraceae bacterium]
MSNNALDLRLQWLIVVVVAGCVLYLLGTVLTPFVVAALFAYLGDPLVDRMERWHVGRWRLGRGFSVALVFLVVLVVLVAILLILVPFLERQIARFITQFPVWIDWFQNEAAPWLQKHVGISPDLLDTEQLRTMMQTHWKEAGGLAALVIAHVSRSGLAVVGWIFNLVLIPVVGFYLLRDWDLLVERVHALVPRSVEPTAARLGRESDKVLGAFLRGQLSVMIALGAYYAIALFLVGIDVGPLIGMLAGLISFVPYLGFMIGIIAALLAAVVQYHDWLHLLLVLGVFAIGQSLEGYVLVPKLVGDRIGLHPVAVIFAVLAGGELFGFVGVLLALPVASVAMVLLRYAHTRYTESALYRPQGEPVVVVETETQSVSAISAAKPVASGMPESEGERSAS